MSNNPNFINAPKIIAFLEEVYVKHDFAIQHGVAILAGNPALVNKRKHSNKINLVEQMDSFEAALVARKFFETKGIPVFISILFDHQKPWTLFLNPDKQTRLKKEALITLDDLIEEIKTPYLEICRAYRYELKEIQVIFEEICRQQAQQWLDDMRAGGHSGSTPGYASLYSALIKKVTSKMNGCTNLHERVSCKGIAGQCIINSNNYAGFDADKFGLFIGYWDDDPVRCDHNFIIGGREIAKKYWNVQSEIINVIMKRSRPEQQPVTFYIDEDSL